MTPRSRACSNKGARPSNEARQLIERLQPTLPVLLANLVSVGDGSRSTYRTASSSCW